jgi:pyruvate dehydrogenase E2 component (dihydrolipoamide acetyltransferase)
VPIAGVRKRTAEAMSASAFTAPHVTEFLTADVTASRALVTELASRRAFGDTKPTLLTIVAKALCLAVRRTPAVNARWDEQAGEILEFGYVDLGIAVATERGLLVPNVKDADALSLPALATAVARLASDARAGRTAPADLTGGTITITNIGVFGIDTGTPIINPPEAAILAMGAVRRQPWEYHGEIALRDVMTLSLSFDHRLIDGEQGARVLRDIAAILGDPGATLALL